MYIAASQAIMEEVYQIINVNSVKYQTLECKLIQSDTKKRELLKNPTKIEEIQEKTFIDRN